MKGILIVAHGSRAKETESTFSSIVETLKIKLGACILEYAFMEFSDQTIDIAVKKLLDYGVTEIKVIPYFLFTGVHSTETIPNMIKKCLTNNPHINIIMGEPLGDDHRLCDILIDRINN